MTSLKTPVQYKKRNSSRSIQSLSVKEAFEQLLTAYKIKGKFFETQIPAYWEKIMGPQISSRTSSIYVKNGKLFLKLTSAPLKKELSMSKTKLLKLLNDECKAAILDDIVFL